MGHLKTTRVGWENERLAEFLLSRISFIANPAKNSDDLGTDFICTLFREAVKNGVVQLFPTSSFALQAKTGEPEELDVSKHLDYLRGLELPFFLGFVDQEKTLIRVYSCHHLPALFSSVGNRLQELKLVPVETLNRDDIYQDLQAATSNPDKPGQLRVVYVTTLAANENLDERAAASSKISQQCAKTRRDIAAKTNGENFFMLDDEVFYVTAGVGSVQTFRLNLAKRILEAFRTLHWMLHIGVPKDTIVTEFQVYRTLYAGMKDLGATEIAIAETAFKQLSKELGQ